MAIRMISTEFVEDLLNGRLSPILIKIKEQNSGLLLCIRKDYINIYHDGGNLMKIEAKYINRRREKISHYIVTFDTNYTQVYTSTELPNFRLPGGKIETKGDAQIWADSIDNIKKVMNRWFTSETSANKKAERSTQHNICLHNNRNSTEYYIVDIEYGTGDKTVEYKDSDAFKKERINARIDMMALKTIDQNTYKMAFIELKYGGGALNGKAGLDKHLRDWKIIKGDVSRKEIDDIMQNMKHQLKTLKTLGLLDIDTQNDFNIATEPECIIMVNECAKVEHITNMCEKNKGDLDLKYCFINNSNYILSSDENKKNLPEVSIVYSIH